MVSFNTLLQEVCSRFGLMTVYILNFPIRNLRYESSCTLWDAMKNFTKYR